MNPVIFAGDKEGQNTKTQWLEKKNIKVFYGDSDNDITAAHDVGARGIRVLRASNSTYRPLPMAGKFGEEVIVKAKSNLAAAGFTFRLLAAHLERFIFHHGAAHVCPDLKR
jgi:hypothetical protein